MTKVSSIVGPRGEALPSSRARRMAAATATAHQAADPVSQELASWWPMSGSADRDNLPEHRLITDRIRDLVRNNGWVAGAVAREVDTVIGYNFRPEPRPDHEALGITLDQAIELADAFEREWTLWANDPLLYCDATRHDNWHGLAGLAFRHRRIDGEALACVLWRPRGGRFATCAQVVDPDRLSNPHGQTNDRFLRGGVVLDGDGAATAYHIRSGHPRDVGLSAQDGLTWTMVPRETTWGRPMVVHDFERTRAGQHRGLSVFAPVLKNLKMLDRFQSAELQTALLNAMLAAFIESPFDHEFLMDILGETGGKDAFEKYQGMRSGFHEKRGIQLGGAIIPALFPGEKIGMFQSTRPSAASDAFVGNMLRNFAAAVPTHTAETVTLDYSKVNYSSARAAMLVAARSILRERLSFGVRFGTPFYHAVIEEAVMMGRIKLPPGAPAFHAARESYLAVDWMGPAQGWVDPVKEAQAAEMRIQGNLSTLKDECADQGTDWRDVLQQRARERAFAEKLGLPEAPPNGAMMVMAPAGQQKDGETPSPEAA